MPITPEQAQAELRRREALAELERRGASPTPEGTWPGEVYRALNRTARQTAAAAPGTLATLIQAGSSPNAYGRWAPAPTPEMEEHTKQTVRKLRRTAELTYKSAEAPELAPRKGGVGGFVVNTGAGALGYMGGAAASAAVAGPAGPFLYGMTTGGESMYQEAMKDMEARTDLTPEEKNARAEVERVVFGPIYGLIEKLQVGKALKPAAVRPLLDAARRRAWGEFARLGGKATAQHLIDAGWEGVEEALQETTEIAAGTVHGRTPQRSDVGRVGTAFLGGAVAGGILKSGRAAVDAVSELRATPPVEPGPMTYTAGEDTSSPGAEIEPLGWGEGVQEGTQLSGSMDVFTQETPVVEGVVTGIRQGRGGSEAGHGVYATTSRAQAEKYASGEGPLSLSKPHNAGEVIEFGIRDDAKIFDLNCATLNTALFDALSQDAKFNQTWADNWGNADKTNRNIWDAAQEAHIPIQDILSKQGYQGAKYKSWAAGDQPEGSYDFSVWDRSIITKNGGTRVYRGQQSSAPTPPATTPDDSRLPISTRNVDTATVRAEEDLPPLVGGQSRTLGEHQALWTEAAPRAEIVDAIADEMLKKPRALTPAEEQGFRLRIEGVRATYDALVAEAAKLEPGSDAMRANLAAREEARSRNDKLTRATRMAGTEWSRTGLSRQNINSLLDDETSPLAMVAKAEEVKHDKLTEPERVEVENLSKKVKEAVEKDEARHKERSVKRANRTIKKGRNRYATMTEAEKDAELVGLIEQIKAKPENIDKLVYQAAMNLGSRPGIENVGDVAVRLQEQLDWINVYTLSDAIAGAMQRTRVETTLLKQSLASLRREAKTNVNLRTAINEVLWHLEQGTVPEAKRAHRTYNEDLQALRDVLSHYTQQMRQGKPARKARLERVLARINAQIANGDYGPRVKDTDPFDMDPDIGRLKHQIAQARRDLYKRINALDPWLTRLRRDPLRAGARLVTQPFREVQAWKSAFDFSALMKQGGIALRSHPIRTLRRVPESIRAMFDPELAAKINYELHHGDRAWYYQRVGLDLTDYDGNLTAREEEMASMWVENRKYLGAGLRASNRGFVTLLNMIRVDAFNAMEGSFASEGGLSLDESRAIAQYVNIMTGRGSMMGLEKAAPVLNGVLWSPRYTLSRFQFEIGMPLIWNRHSWRVRKAIAKEYARYLTGVAVTYFLYWMAFGGTIEKDPRSADAGKLKIGNTRLDPLSGLAQWTVLLARQATGMTKRQSGEVVPLNPDDPEYPYRGSTRLSVVGRFVRSKLGFFPGRVVDKLDGKDFIGRPWSWGRELTTAPVPLGFEDILRLMEDQGVPKGLALETLNLFGDSVQVYDEIEETRGGPRRRAIRRR